MKPKLLIALPVAILALLAGVWFLRPTEQSIPKTQISGLTPTTDLEKFEYSVRAEELLRLQHNEMGAKFRAGEITQEEWNTYLEKDFTPKSRKLGHDKYIFKSLIPIPESPNKDVVYSSSSPDVSLKPEPKSIEEMEQEFKTSTKFQIDLTKI